MTTPAATLRERIVQALSAVHPQPLRVQDLYRAVDGGVEFDAEDLMPSAPGRAAESDPSWRRNVRNVLQQSKAAGTLVNVERELWRLPTPNPRLTLRVDAAWEDVRTAAEKAQAHAVVYESTQKGQRYRVRDVAESRIVVERLDSAAAEPVTEGDAQRAVRYLNAAGGRIGRRTLHNTVAKEVSLVFLHPRLAWSDDREWIEVVGADTPAAARPVVYRDFGEAPDDDPGELAQFARRVRRGQPKFRRNLIELYGGRCAITGWAPAAVLEAAHIRLHADSGINDSKNGILLRADLHALFDDGLLKIEPETRTVVIDPSLAETPYWTLNGTALRPRMDSSQPSTEYLWERWQAGAL